MKILILVDGVKPYGAERVARDLATGLARRHEVTLAAFARRAPDALDEATPFRYQRLACGRGGRTLKGLQLVLALRSLVREKNIDAVVSVMPGANIAAVVACLFTGTGVLVTEHNMPSGSMPNSTKKVWSPYRVVMALTYRWADSVVAVSEAVRGDVARHLAMDPNRLRRIYNPIDYDQVVARGTDVGKDRDRDQRWRPDARRILVVGRLKAAKGHADAIRVLSHLPVNYELFCAGDGQLLGQLTLLSRSLGVAERVHFLGFQENPYSWMSWADVLLVPSLYEGFGLVVAEAAALGVPVVVTDVAALAEVAALTGAAVVPRGDSARMAQACVDAVAGQRQAGRRVDDFRLEVVVDRYDDELCRIAGSK